MADVIACSVVGKLAEYTVYPVLRQVKYLFFYNCNIQNLRKNVQELENKSNDVKPRVDAAERTTEIIGEEVLAWLRKVDDLKERADGVLNGVASSEMGCLFNRCPNLKSRYILSRRATKLTIEADNLKVEGTFERVSYPRPPMQVLNLTSHKVFETRLSTKKKIKEALKDKDISIIGIRGMPGVGKTTMAEEIVNEVKDEKLFEEVAFAVVSNDPDINKIQDQLAETLGLKIEEKTKEVRAGRLHQRLEVKDGKSILVVLDDVWEYIDLGTIGIPSPYDHKGLKIMFTTRIGEMCSEMEAQRKFEIEVLDKEEGWQLFKDKAGISDDEIDVELVRVAREVADECGCLPLALVVVGKALKNKDIHKLRDVLQQLQKSNVTNLEGHKSMYSRIELSYEQLESDEDRDLLMLCSLFAQDESIPIENLVTYARGLELFRNTDTLKETRDRAYSIVLNLKSCYLLQQGEEEDEVKLHDVIRDFCLRKAREDKRGYLVKHAGLIEWPEDDAHESSLDLRFHELYRSLRPGVLSGLKNLEELCLGHIVLEEVEDQRCIIEELSSLTSLHTFQISAPDPILMQILKARCLKNLDKFEILGTTTPPPPPGTDDQYFTRSLSLKDGIEASMRLLPVFNSLMKRTYHLHIKGAKVLKNVVSELDGDGFINLKTLILSSGDFKFKSITSQSNSDVVPQTCFNQVNFPNMESLDVEGLNCIVKLLGKEMPITSLHKLKYMSVSSCDKLLTIAEFDSIQLLQNLGYLSVCACDALEVLFDFGDDAEINMLGQLTSLSLNSVPKLEHIIKMAPKGIPVFQNLTYLNVRNCESLRYLFSLVALEVLSIRSCKALEEIIGREEDEKEENTSEKRNIVIDANTPSNLHHFTQVVSMDAEQNEVIDMPEFPKLDTIELRDLSSFKKFRSETNNDGIHQVTSKSLQNLEILRVEKCKALEVLFDFECPTIPEDHAESVFGRLSVLKLKSLDNLVHIIGTVPKGVRVFENLTSIVVKRCGILKYLFSPSMANSLVALNVLEVSKCGSIEEIIGKEEEGTSEIKIVEGMKNTIVFPNLNCLLLKNLSMHQSLIFPICWGKAGGLAEEDQVCNK
ncbi:unnamed protein product [Fraxinus pennsylvanica]|uniref:AAA+ ATPase domain-containing protein n=1 Tax=Fraxinus pennsylvanica TaxID=56036 RepID=A0AAD2A3N0_9LAMI|nr:unnamed protein product [Fraxinus pennsylvanica]